jgi:hypothetical protein
MLVGCAVFDDQSSVLSGAWGGPDMLILGTPVGAIMQLACAQVTFAAPLRFGQASASGALVFPGNNTGLGAPVRVILSNDGDAADVKLQTLFQGVWRGDEIYHIVRGQPITFPDGQLCGA